MLIIWDTPVMAELRQVIDEVRNTIRSQGLNYLKDVRDIGTDIMVTCTEHKFGQESKPSMGISKTERVTYSGKTIKAGTVHCFTCGYGADLPTWIAKVLGLANPVDGFKWLIKRYTYGVGGERSELVLSLDRSGAEVPQVVTELMVDNYKAEFNRSDRAKHYMSVVRKIPLAICDRYNIGYDYVHDSIIFPICDRKGKPLFTKGRQIDSKVYINSENSNKSATLFGLQQAVQDVTAITTDINNNGSTTVWIVEGEIDMMTLRAMGIIAVAQMGAELSDVQAKLLMRYFDTFVSALDNDKAGRDGTRVIKDKLIPMGARVYNLRYNCSKKDFNAMTEEELQNMEVY